MALSLRQRVCAALYASRELFGRDVRVTNALVIITDMRIDFWPLRL